MAEPAFKCYVAHRPVEEVTDWRHYEDGRELTLTMHAPTRVDAQVWIIPRWLLLRGAPLETPGTTREERRATKERLLHDTGCFICNRSVKGKSKNLTAHLRSKTHADHYAMWKLSNQ